MKLSEDIFDAWRISGRGWSAEDVEKWIGMAEQLEAENATLKRENEAWRQAGEDAVKQLGAIVGLMGITALLTAEEQENE